MDIALMLVTVTNFTLKTARLKKIIANKISSRTSKMVFIQQGSWPSNEG